MIEEFLIKQFNSFGFSESSSGLLTALLLLLLIILIAYFAMKIFRKFFIKHLNNFIRKSQNKWDDLLLYYKIPERITLIIPGVIIYFLSSYFFTVTGEHILSFIHLICKMYIIIIFLLVLNSIMDSIGYIYGKIDREGQTPIKSILQMVKIIIFLIAAIVIISLMLQQSPWTLLKAMGALAAVGMLIFKDPILGLVAGIQLSSQKMLRKGDWIEMPSYGANGNVIDVSLTTVKVQNFDNTMVFVPAYSLVSNSFQNWRGMMDSGGRRIKRSINLDIESIRFLTQKDLESLKKVGYLTDYIEKKEKEMNDYNSKHETNNNLINGMRLTNIGTYRYYVKQYLKHHSRIHQNMTFIVRQLQPNEKGLPLEIYVFTKDTEWVNYEEIQADIFDHLLTVIPEFNLSVYQAPSGRDFRKLTS
ncbi:MAG: mechanosensitive ion channel family protein [Victivallales bacterium]|nr:mechanosensitive ion channel family protein [Victivallales bacterium]